jgi:hypothetical protein
MAQVHDAAYLRCQIDINQSTGSWVDLSEQSAHLLDRAIHLESDFLH